MADPLPMLVTHMARVEAALRASADIQESTGHSLHKGTPRERFIQKFLATHLSEEVAIGTGEIIDATSGPGEPRNQFDVVVYRRAYPKLEFGEGVHGFLAESVVATIEVRDSR